MDEIATAIGMDPVELRRRNFLHDGDMNATEQVMREPVILDQLLDRALNESDYYAKRTRFAQENETNPVKRGLGIAAFYHGSGFTGSGEVVLNSLAGVDVTPDGKVQSPGFEYRIWSGHQHDSHPGRVRSVGSRL